MRRIILKTIIFISGFLCVSYVNAQQTRLPCGPVRIDPVADKLAARYQSENLITVTPAYLIRIYFHVFAYDDGTNPGATPAQINSELTSLLNSYTAANICFLNCGVEYIKSSALDTGFNADTDPTGFALASYQKPNCINIFYMRQIKGNNTACNPPCGYGGIALGGIPGTFFLVATGNIGASNTIGHEMGHNLGLLHTFEPTNGFEKISGANSATAADKVSDTNADPYAYNGSACYSAIACNYTGSCPDPDGQTNFSPPYTNLMSYWVCGNPAATSGQFTRTYSFLNTDPGLQGCSSIGSYVIPTATYSGGNTFLTAINSISSGNNAVIMNGAVNGVIGGGTVDLLPGFIAAPSTGGIVKIISSPCN